MQENIDHLKEVLKEKIGDNEKYDNLVSEMENTCMNRLDKFADLIRVGYLQGIIDYLEES